MRMMIIAMNRERLLRIYHTTVHGLAVESDNGEDQEG